MSVQYQITTKLIEKFQIFLAATSTDSESGSETALHWQQNPVSVYRESGPARVAAPTGVLNGPHQNGSHSWKFSSHSNDIGNLTRPWKLWVTEKWEKRTLLWERCVLYYHLTAPATVEQTDPGETRSSPLEWKNLERRKEGKKKRTVGSEVAWASAWVAGVGAWVFLMAHWLRVLLLNTRALTKLPLDGNANLNSCDDISRVLVWSLWTFINKDNGWEPCAAQGSILSEIFNLGRLVIISNGELAKSSGCYMRWKWQIVQIKWKERFACDCWRAMNPSGKVKKILWIG